MRIFISYVLRFLSRGEAQETNFILSHAELSRIDHVVLNGVVFINEDQFDAHQTGGWTVMESVKEDPRFRYIERQGRPAYLVTPEWIDAIRYRRFDQQVPQIQ